MINKQRLIVLSIIPILILVAIIIFSFVNKSKVKITTEQDAVIFVSHEQGGEFKEIGKTEATYTSSETGPVYIRVEKDNKASVTSADLEKRKTKEVNVILKDPITSKKLTQGPLAFMHFEGKYVYGVNPNTSSIDSRPLAGGDPSTIIYPEIPSASKVVWKDTKNLIVNTQGMGVGQLINGTYYSGLSMAEGSVLAPLDFAKVDGKPIVIVDQHGIYLTNDFTGNGFKSIVKQEISGGIKIFADEKYIYFANQIFPDSGEGGSDEPSELKLTIYDYSGKQVSQFSIDPESQVNKIIDMQSRNAIGVLTEQTFTMVDRSNGNTIENPYYFSNLRDLETKNNGLYALNENGLWDYDSKANVFYLLVPINDQEEYVANSLLINGSNLYYSTKLTREALESNSQADSTIYHVKL